jgi:probable rRNA maturation factor
VPNADPLNVVEIRAINVDNPIRQDEIESFCLRVLRELGKQGWNVSVLLCDDSCIQELNSNYRGIDKPTDVLSFSQEMNLPNRENCLAGDVVISIETMKKNAQEFGVSEPDELKRLLAHGILHLAGMDHDTDAEEGEMLDLQEKILKSGD